MVKGISRQVIVVRSPDPDIFEQAIFILKDGAVRKGITEQELLRQAGAAILPGQRNWVLWLKRSFWALAGAAVTGGIWLGCWLI